MFVGQCYSVTCFISVPSPLSHLHKIFKSRDYEVTETRKTIMWGNRRFYERDKRVGLTTDKACSDWQCCRETAPDLETQFQISTFQWDCSFMETSGEVRVTTGLAALKLKLITVETPWSWVSDGRTVQVYNTPLTVLFNIKDKGHWAEYSVRPNDDQLSALAWDWSVSAGCK